MASYLRPRRGKKATAVAQLTASAPLKRGEVFFEVPDGGVGTGAGKIKMGDGSTAYSSLPYFLEQTEEIDIDTATVGFTNSTAAESSPYSTNATHANAIVPSASMKTIFTNLKQLLLNYNSQLTTLNNDLSNIENITGVGRNGLFKEGNTYTWNSVSDVKSFISSHGVSTGLFTGLYLGDTIKINDGTYNKDWIIAGFDTEYNKGDDTTTYPGTTKHHITLIPKTILFSAQMNSSNTTSGGYQGSVMFKSTLPTVVTNLQKVLSSYLLQRKILTDNSVGSNSSSGFTGWTGASNGWSWVSCYASLMTEVQVYGSMVFGSSGYTVGEGCNKLPIFNFINHTRYSRDSFWLRSVASSTVFALARGYGSASYSASYSSGVRPLIIIG